MKSDRGQIESWQEAVNGMRTEIARAGEVRAARHMEFVAPDRIVIRPAVAVVAVKPATEVLELPTGYLFTASVADRMVEFVTVRPESIVPVQIERIELITVAGMPGLQMCIQSTSRQPISTRLRFHVSDMESFVQVTRDARISVRVGGEWLPVTLTTSGIEEGDALFQSPLGSRPRGLLTAMFHAPLGLTFFDCEYSGPRSESLELRMLFPGSGGAVDPGSIRLNCLPVVNQRETSVHVTVPPTSTFRPIPVPEGEVITRIRQVKSYSASREWLECLPWLGQRHAWKHRVLSKVQYCLRRQQNSLDIGVANCGRGIDEQGVHLNVALNLADNQADQVEPDSVVTGDQGELGKLVSMSPMLCPKPIDPVELDAECLANSLFHPRSEIATSALRALLQQSALPYVGTRGRLPRSPMLPLIEAIQRVTVSSADETDFPGVQIRVDLDLEAIDSVQEFFVASVLDRGLSLLAPPSTATQFKLSHAAGERTCKRRLPIR